MDSTQTPTSTLARPRSGSEPKRVDPVPMAPVDSANGNSGASHHVEDAIDLDVPPPRPVWVIVAAIAGVVLLVSLLLIGLIPRQGNQRKLDAQAAAAASAPVTVNLVKPRRAPEMNEIAIPGNLRPWQEVSIFARTTGYLKKYYVDISNQVEAGQLMAEIETPEVDQQLLQARAALMQTRAAVNKSTTDRNLAQVTLKRYETLAEAKSITEQDLDQKRSDLAVAEANLESAKANVAAAAANVGRLEQMQQFEKIVAPFSGVISGRGYDVGSLILADPSNIDVKPMFKIAENDVLRVFVNVPQSAALQIRKGMDVDVIAREMPNQKFTGKVMGTTNYLDQASRSLLTEVKVMNVKGADGEFLLLPGMYVQTRFQIKRSAPPLVIPAPALVNNADGTQVAIAKDGKVHFVKVALGLDFGNEIEVVGGLNGDEQIIANPGERVVEGVAVRGGSEK